MKSPKDATKLKKVVNGFTLIEMLIVVAIIGILVAIGVPALNTAKTDAQNSKKAAIKAAIALAKNRYVIATPANLYGQTTLFSQISPYMLYNGSTPNISTLANLTNNGTGENVIDLGTYPDQTGAANIVVFGLGPAVTQ